MHFSILCFCFSLSFLAVVLIFIAKLVAQRKNLTRLAKMIDCSSYLITYLSVLIFAASDLIFFKQVDMSETAMDWVIIAFSLWRIESRFNLLMKIKKQNPTN